MKKPLLYYVCNVWITVVFGSLVIAVAALGILVIVVAWRGDHAAQGLVGAGALVALVASFGAALDYIERHHR